MSGGRCRVPESLHRIRAAVGGRRIASVEVKRRWRGLGLGFRRETLARQKFVGCFWSPRRTRRRSPAVPVLGGSEGGLECGAGLLAAHGYPELHVGYFALPGLPRNLERIPLEYFARALRWLARQPGVDPNRLVISRGAEPAILTPILLIGGNSDTLTGSGSGSVDMAAELRAHHRHDFVAVSYAHAGHALASGLPYVPGGTGFSSGDILGPLGGTFAGDARAREDSWRRLLDFLGRLEPERGQGASRSR